jgi:hypothetical protein
LTQKNQKKNLKPVVYAKIPCSARKISQNGVIWVESKVNAGGVGTTMWNELPLFTVFVVVIQITK